VAKVQAQWLIGLSCIDDGAHTSWENASIMHDDTFVKEDPEGLQQASISDSSLQFHVPLAWQFLASSKPQVFLHITGDSHTASTSSQEI
jgi:hypothetical protein